MINKCSTILICLIVFAFCKSNAQPYILQSVGLAKPFSLNLYFGDQGKGAFVKYVGQTGNIALRIKSYKRDTSGRSDGQPDDETFIWDEMIDGKVNGTYTLMHNINAVEKASYWRKKDARKFDLVQLEGKRALESDRYLLHGALISFNHFDHHKLSIQYADGKTFNTLLPALDSPNPVRRSYIADYNFDGYDDIAFSIPDAGMGVYQEFSIFLYNRNSKRFEKLLEPDNSNAKCSCLCDVTLDPKKKLLVTACRGGARWWQDVYRFAANNKLVWVRSKDLSK